MRLHGCSVQRISRRYALSVDDSLGTFDVAKIHGKDVVNYSQECIKCRLNCFVPVDGDIPMQDFWGSAAGMLPLGQLVQRRCGRIERK